VVLTDIKISRSASLKRTEIPILELLVAHVRPTQLGRGTPRQYQIDTRQATGEQRKETGKETGIEIGTETDGQETTVLADLRPLVLRDRREHRTAAVREAETAMIHATEADHERPRMAGEEDVSAALALADATVTMTCLSHEEPHATFLTCR
jgi:hypothetical protein